MKMASLSVMPAFIHAGPDRTDFALSRILSQKSWFDSAVLVVFLVTLGLALGESEQLVCGGSFSGCVSRAFQLGAV